MPRGPDYQPRKTYRKHGTGIPSTLSDGSLNPEYYAAYYAENRERILEKNRRYRASSPNSHGPSNQDYKRMVIVLLRQRDGDICGECGLLMDGPVDIDHLIPKVLGGNGDADNLRLLHRTCNRKRKRSRWQKPTG